MPALITALHLRDDMIACAEHHESRASTDTADPTENTEANDPTDPIEHADPTLPIDSTEPRDPIDSTESTDQSDHRDPRLMNPPIERSAYTRAHRRLVTAILRRA